MNWVRTWAAEGVNYIIPRHEDPPRPRAHDRRSARAARDVDAAPRPVRPGVHGDHGRGRRALALRVPGRERARVPGAGHGARRPGGRDRLAGRARRSGRRGRVRPLRAPDDRDRRAVRCRGRPRARRVGADHRAGRDRRGARGRAHQGRCARPRGDVDRRAPATRGDRAPGPRARRPRHRRLRRHARRVRGPGRPVGPRRRDRRHPEVPELPVGAGAGDVQRAGRARHQRTADQDPQQLSRPRPARGLLEPGPLQPSHRPDLDGVRPARSAARGARRRARGPLRPPSAARRRAARRHRRARPLPLRQGAAGAAAAVHHPRGRAGRRRRAARSPPAHRGLRHRDRRRVRATPGEDLAHRQNILLCLGALEHVLRHEGFRTAAGAGVHAALAHYTAAGATGVLDIGDNLGATGIGRV